MQAFPEYLATQTVHLVQVVRYGEHRPQAVPHRRGHLFRFQLELERAKLPPEWEDYIIPDPRLPC